MLGEFGKAVRRIDQLQEAIDDVAQPGQPRMAVDEIVENVPMKDQNALVACFEDELVLDGDTEQMGDDLGGAVVVAGEPNDFDVIGELAKERKDLPVMLGKPAKIDGIEDIAIEDQPGGCQIAVVDPFQEVADTAGLTIGAAEVEVGQNDSVVHVRFPVKSRCREPCGTKKRLGPADPPCMHCKPLPCWRVCLMRVA